MNDIWFSAASKLAESAGISGSESSILLSTRGAAALLAECAARGVTKPTKPTIAEMPLELMANQGYLTPNSLFYTFARGPVPVVDVERWRLKIGGDGVERPIELSYDDLLRLPSQTVTRYLECAGNGRAFYELLLNKPALGPQWRLGGYGIAEWTGVSFRELLNLAGLKKSAFEVMPCGLDNKTARRPMPVDKALEEDTLLAYLMNGEILPADHGFPVRALLPGWIGSANIKWVDEIIVSTQPVHVTMNTTSYVLIGPDYQPQLPAKGPAITTQVVKSACCLPWPAILQAGSQRITGYAWSPFGRIAHVHISVDGGKSVEEARLIEPNIERAGVRWEFTFDASPNDMTITPRATDDKGNTQWDISRQRWNQFGYLFGAMVPHPIRVVPR